MIFGSRVQLLQLQHPTIVNFIPQSVIETYTTYPFFLKFSPKKEKKEHVAKEGTKRIKR